MKRISRLLVLPLLVSLNTQAESLNISQMARNVVKVMAYAGNGRVAMGSGVVIAENRVATNCHVTRAAQRIAVFRGILRYPVLSQARAAKLDLCVLNTQGIRQPGARLGTVAQAEIADAIHVVGYPHAGGLSFLSGKITALHPHAGSQVIETDAGFMQGASGGAVFNSDGQLIGLTTFLGQSQERGRYFAIPIDWLAQLEDSVAIAPFRTKTFWESGTLFTPAAASRDPG